MARHRGAPGGACPAAILVLILLTGCGASAAPSAPAPAATSPVPSAGQGGATASPGTGPGVPATAPPATPTPAPDTAALLLARLRDPAITARIAIHSTERVPSWISVDGEAGPSVDDLVLESDGEAYLSGDDYLVRMQTIDQDRLAWGELRVDGSVWRRNFGAEPWRALGPEDDPDHPRLFELLAGLRALEPAGETTAGGQRLLRFTAPADVPLDLVTFFHSATAQREPDTGTLEITATPDGTPVTVEATLTSDDFVIEIPEIPDLPAQDRTYEFSFTFSEVGVPVTLPEPAEATVRYDATRWGISIDVPAGFTADTTADSHDTLTHPDPLDPVEMRVYAFRVTKAQAKDQDELLAAIVGWAVNDLVSSWGAIPVSGEEVVVDGRRGYLFAVEAPEGSDDAYLHLEAIVPKGRDVVFVAWHTAQGTELVDRYRLEQLLATATLD